MGLRNHKRASEADREPVFYSRFLFRYVIEIENASGDAMTRAISMTAAPRRLWTIYKYIRATYADEVRQGLSWGLFRAEGVVGVRALDSQIYVISLLMVISQGSPQRLRRPYPRAILVTIK